MGWRKEDARMEKVERKKVLDSIRLFVKREGYAPTVRELAADLGCGHSTVQEALLDLARGGEIRRAPGVARGIVVRGGSR
jgi:SOS-response transcriptional repressor LexA